MTKTHTHTHTHTHKPPHTHTHGNRKATPQAPHTHTNEAVMREPPQSLFGALENIHGWPFCENSSRRVPELPHQQDCQSNTLDAISSPGSPSSPPVLPNYPASSPKQCLGSHFHHPSSETVYFHFRNDALGVISSLRSPRSPPELPNSAFPSPKRCPGSHF